MSFDKLTKMADRITDEVPGVVSVTYNVTKKPPSTIEAV
jgi:GMP synthase (glutamine-hydrolysing)